LFNVNIGLNDYLIAFESNGATNAEGAYYVPFLAVGTYQLTIEAAGFKKFVQAGIHFSALHHPPAHVHHNRQVLIQDRTAFGTGHAGCAGPQGRRRGEPADVRPFYLYVDEFGEVVCKDFAKGLDTLRQFGGIAPFREGDRGPDPDAGV
jgi:hypothetical protein